jgi:hypothetical protein
MLGKSDLRNTSIACLADADDELPLLEAIQQGGDR